MRPNLSRNGSSRFVQSARARFDRQIRVVGDVWNAVEIRDLRIKEIAHEEMLAEPHAAELFERLHAAGF